MSRLFAFLSLLGFTILLSACGPIYETSYDYVPPRANLGNICIAQCVNAQSMCEQNCRLEHEGCVSRAHEDAEREFTQYKRERRRDHLPIQKSVSDFDHSYRCNDRCDCTPAFNNCYSACGGKVITRRTCVAFCNKEKH